MRGPLAEWGSRREPVWEGRGALAAEYAVAGASPAGCGQVIRKRPVACR